MELTTMSEKGETTIKQQKNPVDKDARLRILKEKQNEEKQRKLEEIKAQAFAAQKFKEQKEQERRARLEEMRVKEEVRRQQVEERKKAINDAERDRLESIIRRNQQREIRLEARKRNERSSLVFAFGSSTPRNLDPSDLSSSFWGQRRATSTQNITASSNNFSRRCTERDMDASSKKRASSAGGIDRAGEGSSPTTPAGCASGYLGRRRTDLMPTVPSNVRDSVTRKSLSQSPGRAYSMTRLDQLAKPRQQHHQQQQRVALNSANSSSTSSFQPLSRQTNRQSSVTRSMSHLANFNGKNNRIGKPLDKADSRSMDQLSHRPLIVPRTTRATQLRQSKMLLAPSSNSSDASSRPSSSMSHQSTTSSVSVRHRPSSGARKPRPSSIAITGISSYDKKNSTEPPKPPLPKRKSSNAKFSEKIPKTNPPTSENSPKLISSPTSTEKKMNGFKKPPDTASASLVSEKTDESQTLNSDATEPVQPPKNDHSNSAECRTEETHTHTRDQLAVVAASESDGGAVIVDDTNTKVVKTEEKFNSSNSVNTSNALNNTEMTASQIKAKIQTEEEAKAALAERRRLAKEEAARRAEQDRLRIEAEQQAELERQRQEEEQVRLLIEAQRVAEEQRLNEAIIEAKKREEEEQLKREEEARLKALKDEADKKARIEAEKQKVEQQERLIKEEKEREARRKRVEAIMLRTRGKQNANNQQNADDENKSDNSKLNGTKIEEQNGSSKEERVDNIIQEDSVAITNSTDSMNNLWQSTTQQYGNFVLNNNT